MRSTLFQDREFVNVDICCLQAFSVPSIYLYDDEFSHLMAGSNSVVISSNRATLHDVARLSGVSTATVARVLDGSKTVKPATRDKVTLALQTLNFRRNDAARNLKLGTASTAVGLVVNGFDNPYYAQIAMGAERVLRDAGYHLVLGATDGDPDNERTVACAMLERRVSAMLIISGTKDHDYLSPERAFGTPVIFVGRPPVGINADCVLVDDRAGVREATKSLLNAGHQQIGVLAGPEGSYPYQERMGGYLEAMASFGISPNYELIISGIRDSQEAAAIADDMLSTAIRPTAILGLNRGISVGVISSIVRSEISPAFIGVDDFELAAALSINVIHRKPHELGRRAAELAVQRIASPEAPNVEIVLQSELIRRNDMS
ncbi:LacI family DNA-binding transcriptional regulator [Pseudomonas azerbaijanoccidentalis]|jgi:LacI family transcriptional regulator